jgi:hypothetical protein
LLIYQILTGFTYRELSPHKFTPMPGVHNRIQQMAGSAAALTRQVHWRHC